LRCMRMKKSHRVALALENRYIVATLLCY